MTDPSHTPGGGTTCQALLNGCPNTPVWLATTVHAHTEQHCTTRLVCQTCRDDLISLEAVHAAYYGSAVLVCLAHETRSDVTWRPL